ncbi:hypothetical protein SeLEV6574_g06121 [Synchytrium endobioticum]|uniref:Uncharacterized protein n=1 Tax=Synchytrium endobioticum TaxID=286115 RepID=A0A507CQL9_9FUNG|nr:hypothetical protein SeLEV6574_g06121 [Synchytrium endobioticum]
MLANSTSPRSTPIKKTSLRQPPQRVSLGASSASPSSIASSHAPERSRTPSRTSISAARPDWDPAFASPSPVAERSRSGLKPAIPSASTPFKASASPHETNQLRGTTGHEKASPAQPQGAAILLGFGASSPLVDRPRHPVRPITPALQPDLHTASKETLMHMLHDARKRIATLELDGKVKETRIRDLQETVDSLHLAHRASQRHAADVEARLHQLHHNEHAKRSKLETDVSHYRTAFTAERADKLDATADLAAALRKLREAESIMAAQQTHIIAAEHTSPRPPALDAYLADNAPSYRDRVDELTKRVASMEISLARERKLRVDAELKLSTCAHHADIDKIAADTPMHTPALLRVHGIPALRTGASPPRSLHRQHRPSSAESSASASKRLRKVDTSDKRTAVIRDILYADTPTPAHLPTGLPFVDATGKEDIKSAKDTIERAWAVARMDEKTAILHDVRCKYAAMRRAMLALKELDMRLFEGALTHNGRQSRSSLDPAHDEEVLVFPKRLRVPTHAPPLSGWKYRLAPESDK